MRNWIRFFLGTPRRFLYTLAGLGVLVAAVEPALLTIAVRNVVHTFLPLLEPAIAIAILIFILRMMVRGVFGK